MTVGVVMCPPQVSLLCLACGGLYYDRTPVYVWIRFRQLVDCHWIIWRDLVAELVDIVIYIHLPHLLPPSILSAFVGFVKFCVGTCFFFFFLIKLGGGDFMDYCKVVGLNDYDFIDPKTGDRVAGRKYYLVLQAMPPKAGLTGYEVMASAIVSKTLEQWSKLHMYLPELGEICGIDYNRYGRIAQFQRLEDVTGLFDGLF